MPAISLLRVENFRNLGSVEIEPSSSLNVFVGPNGAGKTSLLESINVLAHGRSFRTHKYRSLITEGIDSFLLFGKALTEEGMELPIGIQRYRNGDIKIKLEDSYIKNASLLASKMPLLVINAKSFQLVEGSPQDRRKFFDWLVFHVKHGFGEEWRNLTKCLKQRNSLLRRDKISYSDLEPWDIEIARISEQIHLKRTDSYEKLVEELGATKVDKPDEMAFLDEVDIHYKSGWKESDGSLSDQLRNNFERDHALGYSTLGPHKADLQIKFGKKLAVDTLSRGQQKLLVSALFIAQANVLKNKVGKRPIFAIDDLPSELDSKSQKVLGRWLERLDSQVFVTGIEEGFVLNLWPDMNSSQLKVFHVKHGTVSN